MLVCVLIKIANKFILHFALLKVLFIILLINTGNSVCQRKLDKNTLVSSTLKKHFSWCYQDMLFKFDYLWGSYYKIRSFKHIQT